ncbi:hypothetical protein QTP86_024756 [Hemibagrus guttatus]|nr:hypothetical protein QTP86_024756 [Hemibagrus guttatus]
MAKWFKEHLGFKSAKASPPAPPRPDYRHCHAAAAAYQHAGTGTVSASYPSPAQPDILAAYKLQKELDFEDPYAAGANTCFSGAALSEVKYVSPKHRLIKVETLERSSASPSVGGGGGGGSAGSGSSGGSATQAAVGSARSPTSPAAEHDTKQDKVIILEDYADPFDAADQAGGTQSSVEKPVENDGYMEPYEAQKMMAENISPGLSLRGVGGGPSDPDVFHILRGDDTGAQSGWNNAALWAVFREGLSPALQTELACWEDATSLSQYVATANRLDNLLRQHRAGARPPVLSHPRLHPDYPRPREEAPEPMQLGRSRLTEREHQRLTQMRLCYYCGGSGHLIHRCRKPSSAQVALIDSGLAVNLIDRALLEELRIPTVPCMPSLRITAIDSQPIGGGYLTHQTELLDFKVGLFHCERLAFYVTSSPAKPVILDFPWLRQHDPQISWHKEELVRWSAMCLSKCLPEPVSHPCLSSVVEDSAPLASGYVPCVYKDFQEVFSRERAARLTVHRAWDCTIDLLPNTSPPKGRVYPLSLPEARAMEEYIEEALAVGHIRPSTSPAAVGFFFVGKKVGGLHPCIDYRGLSAITVRYPYPLPLVPVALEQLRGARFFTKLDLRSAYNLVRIREGDEWKTAFHTTHSHYEYLVMPFGLTNAPAVFQSLINEVFQDILGKLQQNHLYIKPEKCEFHRTTITFLGYVISRQGVEMDLTKLRAVTEWPNPTKIKELQRFLGFANFYRRFIRNYSSVAGPLTSLLRGKPRRLCWSDQAQVAFVKLKDSFTTAPILHHPDPDLPFVVEVDASSSGIGAVLSQRHGVPSKLHPCAFFYRKLTAAGANYDVGNRELLSIKAVLEEWQHWLEGARHPFLVLTDHHNLEYLRSAKRLNPLQARWALFFTRFEFSVTYRPGTKFEAQSEPSQPDLILPAAAILAPDRWSLIEEIQRAHADKPPPVNCPSTKVYVPLQFWWPSLRTDVERFVRSCSTCAQTRGTPTAMQTVDAMFQQSNGQAKRLNQEIGRTTRNLKLKLPCCKLSPKFIGPFEIVHQPAHSPGIGDSDLVDPPPPLDIDGSPAYRVHALLDSRGVRSRLQYLVDWEGYGPKQHSCVDAADILDLSLTEDFHRDHPDKATPRPRGRPQRRTPGDVPGGGSVTLYPRSSYVKFKVKNQKVDGNRTTDGCRAEAPYEIRGSRGVKDGPVRQLPLYDTPYEPAENGGDSDPLCSRESRLPQDDERPPEEYDQPWEWKKERISKAFAALLCYDCISSKEAGRGSARRRVNTSKSLTGAMMRRLVSTEYKALSLKEIQISFRDLNRQASVYRVQFEGVEKGRMSPTKDGKSRPPQRHSSGCLVNMKMSSVEQCMPTLGERIDPTIPLDSQFWYHGAISRTDAESLLRLCKEASYLVRNSETSKNDFSLSLKSSQGFMHMKLSRTKDNKYILGQNSCLFDSVPEIIHFYSSRKLPIKGAEHMSLLYPVAIRTL